MQHQRDLMSFDIRTTSRSTYRSDTIGTWRSLSCWHLNCIMGNIQSYWLYHSPPPTIFRRTPCIILKTVCSLFAFDRYSVNWFTSQIMFVLSNLSKVHLCPDTFWFRSFVFPAHHPYTNMILPCKSLPQTQKCILLLLYASVGSILQRLLSK